MRQRINVDAATEEDEPGWLKVESPKNSSPKESSIEPQLTQAKDGSGLQVSENLQSYMQTGSQMTTEEYKRGRKLLSEKKGTLSVYDTFDFLFALRHTYSFSVIHLFHLFLFFVSLHFYFQYFSCSPIISY